MIFLRKKKPLPQLHGLLIDLFGGSGREYDRQVASLDLGGYDEPIAEQALIHIARQADEGEVLVESCGTSIGDIWRRKCRFDEATAAILALGARRGLAKELVNDFPAEVRKLKL